MGCDDSWCMKQGCVLSYGHSGRHDMGKRHEPEDSLSMQMPDEDADHLLAEYIKSSSSQADVMRDDAQMPGMYKNSIAAGGCVGGSMYTPHTFQQTVPDLIGGPCIFCGQPATAACHVTGIPPNPLIPATPELTLIDPDAPRVDVSVTSETSATYEISNIPNEQATRIINDILPRVLRLYLSKSRDYNGNVMSMLKLGPKASFVDLWRKIGKLKGALWDGRPMVGEQADEILSDCIGHILITLDEMEQDK